MNRAPKKLTILAMFLLPLACGSGAEGPWDHTAPTREELVPAFRPAFVVLGASDCTDIDAGAGVWSAQSGEWTICQSVVRKSGCGYAWSSASDSKPDLDALASGVGSFVDKLIATYPYPNFSPLSPQTVCVGPSPPSGRSSIGPGSTPCGACRVGIGTSTHVYVSLPSASSETYTLVLFTDSLSMPTVTVRVPANTAVFSEAMALPADFGQGLGLYSPLAGREAVPEVRRGSGSPSPSDSVARAAR
jgi:hypothetical protein